MNRHERRRRAKNDRETERAEFRLTIQAMAAAGYIVPTGEMRPDRQGVPQPVYVLRKYAAEMGLPLPPLLPLLPFSEDLQ